MLGRWNYEFSTIKSVVLGAYVGVIYTEQGRALGGRDFIDWPPIRRPVVAWFTSLLLPIVGHQVL